MCAEPEAVIRRAEPERIRLHEEERLALTRVLQDASAGQGGMVIVSGEAGIGKTTLVEECLAESGFETYVGRSLGETGPAYGPIVSGLRECLRRSPDRAADCGAWTPYLALLLPELGVDPRETDRETLAEAIAFALSASALRRPAAFLLDDLHWADSATLEMLPILADRARRDPLILIGTCRMEEVPRGHRLRWMRNELRRRRLLREIALRPLNERETAGLLSRSVGAPVGRRFVRAIYEKTNGIPLLIDEVFRAVQGNGRLVQGEGGEIDLPPDESIPIPDTLRDALHARLEGLSQGARRILEAAAVAGFEFEKDLLFAVAGKADGLEELFERGILMEGEEGRVRFRHTVERDTLREEIPRERLRSFHTAIASELENRNGSPEERAEHWRGAGETARARKALLESAEHSCRVHAYWDATQSARRALKIWPEGEEPAERLDVLERLAHCAQVSGQLIVATQTLEDWLRRAGSDIEPKRRARVHRGLATLYGLQERFTDTLAAREAAQRLFEEAGKPAEAAIEAMAMANTLLARVQRGDAQVHADKAVALAVRAGNPALRSRALALQGYVLATRGKIEEGRERVEEGLSLALEKNLHEVAAEVFRRRGSVMEYASDFAGARDAFLGVLDQCRKHGVETLAIDCMGCLAWVLFRTGDWKQALGVGGEVQRLEDPPANSLCTSHGVVALIQAMRGEVRSARAHARKARTLAQSAGIELLVLLANWGLAVTEEISGHRAEAGELYREFLQSWWETDDRHDVISGLMWAIGSFAEEGAKAEMSRATEGLALMASETGNPEALAGLAYALGESALLKGNVDEAITQFRQAVDHFEALSIPFELAQAEFRLGVALERAGAREESVRHLTNAYRRMKKMGARPRADMIAAALQKAGERPDEREGPERGKQKKRGGLTRRQTEILRLIADGLTNKEIAGKLHLSPRTVEMHSSHVLDRLNCRSRSEAVRKAGQMGIVD